MAAARRAGSELARGKRVAGLALALVAIATHIAALAQNIGAKPSFAWTATEAASTVGLCLALVAVIAAILKPAFTGPSAIMLALAGIVGASTDEGARTFVSTQSGWELTVHIGLSIVAYTLVTVGATLAIALTLLDRRLRRRQSLGWLSMLPSVEALELGMFQAMGAGFAILSLALFSGFFFVHDLFAQHLPHKVAFSLLSWLCLAILLIGRWRFGWRGRTALYWILSTFALLWLAYFGSKLVLESMLGRHWG